MKNKNLTLKNSIPNNNLKKNLSAKYLTKIKKIEVEILKLLKKPNNIYYLLNQNFKFNFNLRELEKFKNYKNIAIIGMGGSILGSMAIHNFLKIKIKKKLFFFDNINQDQIFNFKKNIRNDQTLFLVISKSGNTIETIVNFLALTKKIKKKQKNLILISERKNNILFEIATKFNLFYVEHKDYVGGRYSIFSEVGILPSYLMGLNIKKLQKNSKRFLFTKEKLFLRASCLKIANLIKQKKLKSLIFLNYSPELEDFLYWCQQLIAESLGKKNYGLLPMISNVPKDHHSLLQLYLDGPKDKLFYVFSTDINLGVNINAGEISKKLNYLRNKDLFEVKKAQKKALIETLKKNKMPFREFKINKIDEEVLSELFSYFILETSIIGKLIDIDPFNQPAVEQVKKNTMKFLK